MADERSENRIAYWGGEQFVMDSYKSGWTVRALFSWSANLYRAPRQIAPFRDTRHAVMLPVATAACGQARRSIRAQREYRRDDREAKDSQQQDGK
jgi:hypothetical protein